MTALFLNALGVVNGLGRGKAAVAESLFAGRRGLRPETALIAGRTIQVGAVDGPLPAISDRRHASRNNRLMLAALDEIGDALNAAVARFGRNRIAVVMGTSTSGIAEGEAALAERLAGGAWPDWFDYRQQETGSLGLFAAEHLGLSGPAYTVATACSSSAKVFAAARRLIRTGLCDAAVIGGADSLCRMTLNGFDALASLSPGHCNPFSVRRDGINIGEGAAVFLMSPDPAPVALLGVGESSDAHHVNAPDPEGKGAMACMSAALTDAGLSAGDIAYLNLHGTATPLNDAMESWAVAAVFGDVPCSSTKAMTGHPLGAAGATEAAFLWLSLHPDHGRALPPHVWDGAADPDLPPLRFVAPGTAAPAGPGVAMASNSFAFGGNNATIVLGRP